MRQPTASSSLRNGEAKRARQSFKIGGRLGGDRIGLALSSQSHAVDDSVSAEPTPTVAATMRARPNLRSIGDDVARLATFGLSMFWDLGMIPRLKVVLGIASPQDAWKFDSSQFADADVAGTSFGYNWLEWKE